MDFASNLIKEQQVVRLLKDYCETPRSFEQIEHFLAQDCLTGTSWSRPKLTAGALACPKRAGQAS